MMSPELICGLGFLAVIALLLARAPIGVALGLIGVIGLALVISPEAAIIKSGVVAWETASRYELGVLPLFLLMANVLFSAGVSSLLFDAAAKFIGHKPGGLALASIIGCAGFGAVSGSSLATAATMGLVAVPEMRKAGYDPKLATGALAAGGTLGSLIPPSAALIVFGVIAEQSIRKLFMAGIVPALSQAAFYMLVIFLLCLRNPALGPAQPRANWAARFKALRAIADIVVLVLGVLTGIMIGWFTPTEAASVGAIGALGIAAWRKKLSKAMLIDALMKTLQTAGMIYLVIIGALVFSAFVSATDFAAFVSRLVDALPGGALGAVIGMAVILLVLGTFIDGMGIMLLTTPIFLPVIESHGLSPVWFGIFLVRTMEIGLVHPPVGMNIYVIHGIARDVSVMKIFSGVLPFLAADFIHLALLIAFPIIALWLPQILGA
ncbi:MAG TPA: TRAP transporter large permease [Hyphomonadaceae bacterium]|jgi:tripartite ATP-independent transporter DctM subunit|nr:TRAP transporter large permease [Hyphomonadaceae bacterium]